MLLLLVIMFGGILIGYLLRKHKKLIKPVDKITMLSIFLLLFLIGVSIGSNKEIISNLGSLGIIAVLLSSGAIIGSILLSIPIYKKFFQNNEAEK